MRKVYPYIFSGLFLLFFAFDAQSQHVGCLRIGVEDTAQHRLVGDALQHYFESEHFCHEVSYYPAARLNMHLDAGFLQGVAFRTDTFAEKFEGRLKKIAVPLLEGRGAIMRQEGADTPIAKFGVMYGEQWAKDLAKQVTNDILEVRTYEQGVELLRRGRLDAFIMPDLALRARNLDLEGLDVAYTDIVQTFLYVNQEFNMFAEDIFSAMQSCEGADHGLLRIGVKVSEDGETVETEVDYCSSGM